MSIAIRTLGVIDPAAMRRAVAAGWRKLSHGAGKMPRAIVQTMFEEYQRTGSLRSAGRRFNRHSVTLARIFRSHGFSLKRRGGPNHKGKACR